MASIVDTVPCKMMDYDPKVRLSAKVACDMMIRDAKAAPWFSVGLEDLELFNGLTYSEGPEDYQKLGWSIATAIRGRTRV